MSNEETCLQCGGANPPGSAFCENCGKQLGPAPTSPSLEQQPQPAATPSLPRKSPMLAAILGILIAGLGDMYVGKWLRGAAIFILAVIAALLTGGLLWLLFIIISAVDGYLQAQRYNQAAGYAS
jgi:TM2 domain-containing membrane protein YozV